MSAGPGEPQHWLAETKFSPPVLREDVIPRPRLLDDLRLSLFFAPYELNREQVWSGSIGFTGQSTAGR